MVCDHTIAEGLSDGSALLLEAFWLLKGEAAHEKNA
jgi:hypothetical protein